ncbi:Uncharacterised protein [Mycobacteroides abscessus subsp. abscessus]|nr:Uncharacterised protein [Mycobacteroides abscessus subsp. abscessus]
MPRSANHCPTPCAAVEIVDPAVDAAFEIEPQALDPTFWSLSSAVEPMFCIPCTNEVIVGPMFLS